MAGMANLFDRYLQESDAFAAKSKTPELGKTLKCLKIILLVANVIFLIFGCVLMGVGSYAYNNHKLGTITGSTLPLGIVVLGVFIMFLSFLGCVAAWRESRIALGLYFFFLAIMTFLLLVVGIAVYVKKNDAKSFMRDGWNSSDDEIRGYLEQAFECCGLEEWNATSVWASCPEYVDAMAGRTYTKSPPCLGVLADNFDKSFNTVGSTGIAFAVLMAVFMVFVCLLMRGIRQKSLQADVNQIHTDNAGGDSANPSFPDPTAEAAASAAADPQPAAGAV